MRNIGAPPTCQPFLIPAPPPPVMVLETTVRPVGSQGIPTANSNVPQQAQTPVVITTVPVHVVVVETIAPSVGSTLQLESPIAKRPVSSTVPSETPVASNAPSFIAAPSSAVDISMLPSTTPTMNQEPMLQWKPTPTDVPSMVPVDSNIPSAAFVPIRIVETTTIPTSDTGRDTQGPVMVGDSIVPSKTPTVGRSDSPSTVPSIFPAEMTLAPNATTNGPSTTPTDPRRPTDTTTMQPQGDNSPTTLVEPTSDAGDGNTSDTTPTSIPTVDSSRPLPPDDTSSVFGDDDIFRQIDFSPTALVEPTNDAGDSHTSDTTPTSLTTIDPSRSSPFNTTTSGFGHDNDNIRPIRQVELTPFQLVLFYEAPHVTIRHSDDDAILRITKEHLSHALAAVWESSFDSLELFPLVRDETNGSASMMHNHEGWTTRMTCFAGSAFFVHHDVSMILRDHVDQVVRLAFLGANVTEYTQLLQSSSSFQSSSIMKVQINTIHGDRIVHVNGAMYNVDTEQTFQKSPIMEDDVMTFWIYPLLLAIALISIVRLLLLCGKRHVEIKAAMIRKLPHMKANSDLEL